jgi:hypothetical protein
LIGALLHFSLPTIGGDEKDAMRELAMRGGPWTDAERASLLAYCETDVDAVLRLLEPLLDAIGLGCADFARALLRGRYMASVGVVENNGIPIDVDLYQRLILHWSKILKHLIDEVDADFGIYEDGRFVEARFEAYLVDKNIPWPRLASGRLALDDDTNKRGHFRLSPRSMNCDKHWVSYG